MSRFHKLFVALSFAILLILAPAPRRITAPQLIELAQSPGPALRERHAATFDAKDLQEEQHGRRGSDFFFRHTCGVPSLLMIDVLPGPT